MNPSSDQGGAAFPGDGSGATSGYGEETLADELADDDITDDEVINGEALDDDEDIADDLDDDVA